MLKQQIRRIWLRTRWSWEGLAHVWHTEHSLKQWIIAYAISVLVALLLPITAGETALLLMGGVLVFAFECLNTAIERTVDHISMERHPLAKQAKDTASAAVALSAVALALAWVVILVGLAL
ncbi:diacylglycerol kinase [Vannielia litorea]|uniref:diacylglycerol kinase n=1 Tax=Vannielia litorea TaxID=1217970 RepID=UPI001C948368|nr:diacylglycerol kinase [Vannielia litorea]MBY6155423.1 diacylglycerol kinase [Vannielia litorea]